MFKTKFGFYNSKAFSTLLYSCETWHLKTSQEKKLDAFNTRCIRNILNTRWNDFIIIEDVREQSKQSAVSSVICRWQLKWLGHVVWLPSLKACQPSVVVDPRGKKEERPDPYELAPDHPMQPGLGWQEQEQSDDDDSRQVLLEGIYCLMCQAMCEQLRLRVSQVILTCSCHSVRQMWWSTTKHTNFKLVYI